MQCKWSPGPRLVYVSEWMSARNRQEHKSKSSSPPNFKSKGSLASTQQLCGHTDSTDDIWLQTTTSEARGRTKELTPLHKTTNQILSWQNLHVIQKKILKTPNFFLMMLLKV